MEGRIEEEVFLEIVQTVAKILQQEPNVLNLKYPITGDLRVGVLNVT